MIKKIYGNLYVVAGLWAAFLGYGFYLFNYSIYPHLKVLSKGMDLPEEIFGATWDYQTVFVDELAKSGVAQYATFQWLDFVNALLLGIVLSATICLILSKLEAAKAFYAVAAVPLLTSIADFIENGIMIANLGNFPDLDKGLSGWFMTFTQIKLILGSLSFLILLICIVALAVTVISKRLGK
ncbi:MAG: hypothetical protein HKN33_12670 [Pyrinomonadaceae bacterium]|nr:hypothetical protein [Pyrinomonadaceae bacterium]